MPPAMVNAPRPKAGWADPGGAIILGSVVDWFALLFLIIYMTKSIIIEMKSSTDDVDEVSDAGRYDDV